MSNETDLDWLARNVHVWPAGDHQPWCYVVTRIDGEREWAGNVIVCSFPYTKIEREQWLSRRAELQNKPSWDDAPEWGEWLAQDEDGEWKWLAGLPGKYVDGWTAVKIKGCCKGSALGDWRDTLEKRPEQTIADICREVTGENRHEEIFEPFVSVDDAKISILQSEGDIKHFGGVIGRNILAKEDAETAKQPAPKGSGNPILGMVLADLTNRALEGKEKYGEPLLAHNGRNPLWDAYQEALDLAMYLRQAIEELG